MSENEFKPDDAGLLVPYLSVSDPAASLDFYERAFGFERSGALKNEKGEIVHAEMKHEGQMIIMLGQVSEAQTPAQSGTTAPIGMFVYCRDVDSVAHRAEEAGAEITSPLQDMFWGDRMVSISDMDGYRWNFATKVAEFDPANVPEGLSFVNG